ncbi:hypothetical protein KI688_010412 [Linnemannia hyalina]|uniref:Uncharacterized protein n=1 Tax=Linnemannia hyalina TaxID=64524 RepID=A0A9P7Y108_9FUNG|nr:hypothetical protein KI688_010412 [Linnemannia hyalina]
MSITFPLPTECLHMVIRHLADQSDINTLSNLLRVNKYVLSTTLPIMYEHPFRSRPVRYVDNPIGFGLNKDDGGEVLVSSLMMVRTLLLSLPRDHVISDLLRAAFLQVQPTDQERYHPLPPEPISIPYYSFVTKIDPSDYWVPGNGNFFNMTLADRTTLKNHLEHRGQTGRYLLEEVPVNIPMEQQQHFDLAARAATRELRSDLTWALCFANAEHIQELLIPIMDITRYVALVPRLKVLSKVTFLLDKGFQVKTRYRRTYTPAEQEQLESQKLMRILAFREMISFVQEHCRLFPHVLKLGRCRKDPYASNRDCPKEYEFRLLQALPPLISPTVLDQQNWTQFVVKAHETDLSLLKAIQPSSVFSRRTSSKSHALVVDGPFLHRCRVLESVIMPFLDDDTFQWAVDERKQHDADIAAGWTLPRPLVPLRIFSTNYGQPAFGRQVNDVAFAFGRTLEKISASSEWWERLTDHEAALEFSIGEGDNSWDLPRLSELLVHMRKILISIHPDVISRCPRLSRIFLVDRREEYRLDEVVRWTPTELPLLKELVLNGTPAISFHPDILHSTTNLRDLDLGMFTSGADVTFIPPAEELDCADDDNINDNNKNNDSLSTYGSVPRKQPTWTWDWYLPNLLSLKLNAEFGYRFKFRMLAGTPNLVRFIVGIGSRSGQHKRTIGIADLIKPGYQHLAMDRFLDQEQQRQRWTLERQHVVGDIDNSSSPIELEENDDKFLKDFEYVHVPALKNFTLTGPWSLDRRVLEVLFGKVAPGVQDLIMSSEDIM